MDMTYDTEQEENDYDEPPDPAGDRAPEDPAGCCDAGILRLLGDMTGSVEPDENPCRGKVRQTPVPPGWSTCAVVGRHEGVVGGSEPVDAFACRYGQPYHVQSEVNEDECGR